MSADTDAAGAWRDKGDADLQAAELLLKEGLPEIACYHAQQCAEKHLKGYLVSKGAAFKFVHELVYLVNLCCSVNPDFEMVIGAAAELQDYATDVRYPGDDGPPPTSDDAQAAINRAREIRVAALNG